MQSRVCLYLIVIISLYAAPASAAGPVLDFRIVIDASARMQELDPASRLESAVKMLNGLIPEGSRAGIWTYGRYVEMVGKWGRVDSAWREQADLATTKIRSSSNLQNLDQALARARVGWQKTDPAGRRVLLLVTAGGVRVSRDPAENDASRERLLDRGLAQLVTAGVELHAIGLGAESDAVLLQRLAIETGGSYRRLDDARGLLAAFYQVYERLLGPDTISIEGNAFAIDSAVTRLRLLLFDANRTRPALLVPPDSPAISASKPRMANWRSGDGFDLIVVDNPEPGNWRIDADMDPANRLLVESSLELRVSGIPVRESPRNGFTVAAELFRNGEKIRRNNYLRFVDFRLTHIDVEGARTEHRLEHTSQREDKGRYLVGVEPGLAEGRHRFVVSASSSAFERRQEFSTHIEWPALALIRAGAEAGHYLLEVRAREQYLDPAGMVVEAEIISPGGKRTRLQAEASADGSRRVELQTNEDGLHNARVSLSAKSHRGEITDIELASIPFIGVKPAAAAAENADASAADAGPSLDRKRLGFIIVGINLTLLLALLIGWLVLRRRKAAAALAEGPADEVVGQLADENAADESNKAA